MKNVVVDSFRDYNVRRYSMPWVCKVSDEGKCDFGTRIGCYTGTHGTAGDIVIFSPEVNQVYAYGQKDYRKIWGTIVKYIIWNGENFEPCDKLGRRIKE